MDAVLRAAAIYLFLLLIFRIAGKRSLAQITTFDLVLLLVIGEATQQGLLGDDFSVTNALVVICTLVGIDIVLSLLKEWAPAVDRWTEGTAVVIVENGSAIEKRMHKARVDLSDVLSAARATQGLERLDQIKYAVVEKGGSISIVPYPSG